MGQKKTFTPAFKLALCSLMAALGTTIMLSSSLVPILTYTAPLIAGLMLIPVLVDFGRKHTWMTWGVTALLSLLICADREAAFFYLFLGYYPIIKFELDRIESRFLRRMAKVAVITASLCILLLLLAYVLGLEDIRGEMILSVAVYVMLIAVMMIYDRALERINLLYISRIRNKLFKQYSKKE